MSDTIESPDLAGEYVLGTLDGAERAAAERRLAHDRAFRADVARWELRLAPLARGIRPLAPPGWIWRRLEHGIAAAPVVTNAPPRAARGLAIWRGVTAASLALAASLGIVVALEARNRPAGPATALVAYGQKDAAFVAERLASGAVDVRPVGSVRIPSGRDLELWAAVDGSRLPVPLGVLPAGGRRIAAGAIPAGTAKLLVSLEPKGGSPTGLPTGPVLFAGSIIRSD